MAERRIGKRGRPRKFGRPSQLIALTIPDDVMHWLRSIHSDPGWAIVALHQRLTSGKAPSTAAAHVSGAELVQLTPKRALIVVRPSTLRGVKDISILPLSQGRAFVALENGRGLADLEVAILDRLDDQTVPRQQREALMRVRDQVKAWRQSKNWRVTSRSIILLERRPKRTLLAKPTVN